LDEQGNSARGIQVCAELSDRFKFHMFKSRTTTAVVVRRTYRGDTIRSKRRRGSAERAVLNRAGSAICVFELQGSLYFGTMERVLRQLMDEINSFAYLILDLKRVLQLDECATTLLFQTQEMLQSRRKILLLTHLPDHCSDLLVNGDSGNPKHDGIFADIDTALEWCEDQLLREEQAQRVRECRRVGLRSMEILAGFDNREVALIESIVKEVQYGAGDKIIREGDTADSLYLLAAGRVSICLSIKNSARRQRLSTISPGLAFGELALLDGGTRSADVIADEPTHCYVLPIAELQVLGKNHPAIEKKLIFNIARELSARLRRADEEIRSLAD
jgi:glutaminase